MRGIKKQAENFSACFLYRIFEGTEASLWKYSVSKYIHRKNWTGRAGIQAGGDCRFFCQEGRRGLPILGLMVKIKHGKLGAVPKLQLIQNGA